jgi:hypothetical protein
MDDLKAEQSAEAAATAAGRRVAGS